jgi:hypothetical protein
MLNVSAAALGYIRSSIGRGLRLCCARPGTQAEAARIAKASAAPAAAKAGVSNNKAPAAAPAPHTNLTQQYLSNCTVAQLTNDVAYLRNELAVAQAVSDVNTGWEL